MTVHDILLDNYYYVGITMSYKDLLSRFNVNIQNVRTFGTE